jgi:hypothetical protein
MNLFKKTARVNIISFKPEAEHYWFNQLKQAGVPVTLSHLNGHDPAFAANQIVLYLDPDFDEYQQRLESLHQSLTATRRQQFILSGDTRWKEIYPNGNPVVLPQQTHPLELARLLVEQYEVVVGRL